MANSSKNNRLYQSILSSFAVSKVSEVLIVILLQPVLILLYRVVIKFGSSVRGHHT